MSSQSNDAWSDNYFAPLQKTAYLNYGKAADLVLDAHSVLSHSEDKTIVPDYKVNIGMVLYEAQNSPQTPSYKILQKELMVQAQALAGQRESKDEAVANMYKRFVDAKLIIYNKPTDKITVHAKSIERTKQNLEDLKFLRVAREVFAAWQYDRNGSVLPTHQGSTPG
ncbi:MAG TPA: hypothetical protein VGF14_02960 [Alphaproteobacteria bacterium]